MAGVIVTILAVSCNGRHSGIRAIRRMYGDGAAATPARFCRICDVFITWDGIYCPRCNSRIRRHHKKKRGNAGYTVPSPLTGPVGVN